MKKTLFTFALLSVTFTANAQFYNYDVNHDGTVTITDIAFIANKILGVPNPGETPQAFLTCPDDHHPHMIDLGLPSGTLWACCNVGADKPETRGGTYAWGEMGAKSYYDWSTYSYCDGVSGTCHKLGSDIAGTQYDVAHILWGGPWVMPNYEQIKELVNNCSFTWTKMNDVKGCLFTGPSGGTIFLPSGGYRGIYGVFNNGYKGYYWSSTQHTSNSDKAYLLQFDEDGAYSKSLDRRYGPRVRPVCVTPKPLSVSTNSVTVIAGESTTLEITSGNGDYIVSSADGNIATVSLSGTTITVTGLAIGSVMMVVLDTATSCSQLISVTVNKPHIFLTCPDNNHPHVIDLGLPSGTKWACCNVGANKPEAYGGYFSWGETEEKDMYNHVTYLYATGEDNNGDGYYDNGKTILNMGGVWQNLGDDISGTSYDVAHVKWGGSWVMPSINQIRELVNNCSYSWSVLNGVYGGLFTGPSGGTIFLPAAGHRWEVLDYAGSRGSYWSSTQSPAYSFYAYDLVFFSDHAGLDFEFRDNGHTVRPIWVP